MPRIREDHYNFVDDLIKNIVMIPVWGICFLILLAAVLAVYAYIILPVVEFFKNLF